MSQPLDDEADPLDDLAEALRGNPLDQLDTGDAGNGVEFEAGG